CAGRCSARLVAAFFRAFGRPAALSIPALPVRHLHERAIPAPPFRPESRCSMPVQPYLFFEGRADEAIAFYRKTLDAEVVRRMTYGDSPEGSGECPDGSTPPADKVMHADLRIDGTEVSLSDGKIGRASCREREELTPVAESSGIK